MAFGKAFRNLFPKEERKVYPPAPGDPHLRDQVLRAVLIASHSVEATISRRNT